MKDNDFTADNIENQSFEKLLDSFEADSSQTIQVGDKIKGEIISIGKESVFIDTGTGIDGVIALDELLDDKQKFPYSLGDSLELYVVSMRDNEIGLSRSVSGAGGLNQIETAYERKIPIDGKVKEVIKGGFHISIMQKRAFCPLGQIDINYVENPEDFVGKTLQFLIIEFKEGGKNIVLSRRELLSLEQEKAHLDFLETLTEGSIHNGTITRIMPYGVFVELIPGTEGMVHVSELSWSRLNHPEELVKQGDCVAVKIIGIEHNEQAGKTKISLSAKQVQGDPWESVSDKFSPNDKIKGIVTRCAKFGAFVEIAPGIEGLVHISEMSYTKRVIHPEDVVKPGESVSVMIKDIDQKNRRISLSIKEAEGDPWVEVPDKYSIGQSVDAIIEKKEQFGLFITLEPGVTGLLPKSEISRSSNQAQFDKIKEGDPITVLIGEINPAERKISLRPGDAREDDEWKEFSGTASKSLGTLGDKLQQALKSKKKT
ncbi:MAG: 30S ribosomal protein S1 [Deltaproteobacteria bacterium]|nr:30S ribosomal protein S1 [Deltaproteobacteria bacterium]